MATTDPDFDTPVRSMRDKRLRIIDSAQCIHGAPVKDPLARVLASFEGGPTGFAVCLYGEYLLAGVDWRVRAPLPAKHRSGVWYWPVASARQDAWNIRAPRYRTFRDAALVSLRANRDAVHVVARAGGMAEAVYVGADDFEFYIDDTQLLAPGVVDAWFRDLVAKAKTAPPVPWGGSDDPML